MRVNSTVCTTNSRHLDTTAQAVHKHVGHRHRRHTHGHSTTQRTSAVDASVADTLYQHLDADPLIPAMYTVAMVNAKVTRDAAAKLEPQATHASGSASMVHQLLRKVSHDTTAAQSVSARPFHKGSTS